MIDLIDLNNPAIEGVLISYKITAVIKFAWTSAELVLISAPIWGQDGGMGVAVYLHAHANMDPEHGVSFPDMFTSFRGSKFHGET